MLGAIAFDNSASDFGLLRYDGVELVHTGLLFVNDSVQGLFVSINFANNTWTARLDGVPVFLDQPFNATDASLDLGSIAAEWEILTPGQPGNNWMLFDEWTVTANAAVDDEAPVISNVPTNITTSTDPGKSTAMVHWAEPTAIDNIGVTSFNSAPANGGPFSVGETTVIYTASDAAGNSTIATFKVTVQDTEAPAIVGMPQNVSVTVAPGQASAPVTWLEPTAADNVGVVSFSSNFQSGDVFPEGTTTVTYAARDAAGNERSASFTVTVTVTSAGQSYLQWWSVYFKDLPVDSAGDADQDGLSNLFEFGMGTHPLIASGIEGVAAAPRIVAEPASTTIDFNYEFVTTQVLAPGVLLEVVESLTLNNADGSVIASRVENSPWTGPAVTAGELETTTVGASKMLTRIAIDSSVALRRFYWLRITAPIE
ncbi:MAG: HYR domain-containing protein [Verrucomicrobiales bacterium]